jgi:hypothetical protein
MLAVGTKSSSTSTRVIGFRRIIFQISTVAGLFIIAIVEVLGITGLQKRLDAVDVKIAAVSQRLNLGVLSHPPTALVQAPAVLVTPPRVAPVQPPGQLAVLIPPPIVAPIRPSEQLTIPHSYRPVASRAPPAKPDRRAANRQPSPVANLIPPIGFKF